MAHDFSHCDRMFRWVRRTPFLLNHLALELRQIFLHRIVKFQLPLINQHHQSCGGEGLCHGGDVEEIRRLDRLFRRHVAVAQRLKIENLVLVGDEDHRTGNDILFDERL
jgi:hypothetical protein